jgi:hypothetical protein
MNLQFKLNKTDRYFISEKYLCNGRWLTTKDAVKRSNTKDITRSLTQLASLSIGTHSGLPGSRHYYVSDKVSDLDRIIPKRDGYLPINIKKPQVTWDCDTNLLKVFIFEVKKSDLDEKGNVIDASFKIGVSPNYVPLLSLGYGFAKDSLSPILILDGPTLNDQLVGLVMPMRI